MKILVIGDLHGRKPKIHFKDFDCIIQVGDVCDDKEFRPYIDLWFKIINDLKDEAPTSDELILSSIGEKGLKNLEENSLKKGRKILEYLNSFGKPVFFVPGNWDQSYGNTKIINIEKNNYNYLKSWIDRWSGKKANPFLIKNLNYIKDCQQKNYSFGQIEFIGYGLCNAPENFIKKAKKLKVSNKEFKKLKEAQKKIFNKLSNTYKKRNKKFPTIFISHNIPYNTKLDVGKDKNSYAYKKHLGSWIARKFCEKYQPLICVGGHVHEGKGKDKIGKTLVINPGFGKDAQVLIDVDEEKGKVRSVKFYGKK